MKVVILAGGLGTRLAEETIVRPKPMVEIGGRPILWHIMKLYTHYGITDFVICLGYRGYCIKEYFANYFLHMSDVTFDVKRNTMTVHRNECEPWQVTLLDTGLDTMTGGRLKRVASYLDAGTFCLTYGDGVSDVDITAVIEHHKQHRVLATMTVVQPPGRYGAVNLSGNLVRCFNEKPKGDGAWVNGGFFVLETGVIDYIQDDSTVWEKEAMQRLASDKLLCAYKHQGFWQAMDTLRDKNELEQLWSTGAAPWKTWKD
jgi:glucose-1-phosphate cytidylyltransferase